MTMRMISKTTIDDDRVEADQKNHTSQGPKAVHRCLSKTRAI